MVSHNCNLNFVIYISSRNSFKLAKKNWFFSVGVKHTRCNLCKYKLSKLLEIICSSFIHLVVSWTKKNFKGCFGLCVCSTIKKEQVKKMQDEWFTQACKSYFTKNWGQPLFIGRSHKPNHMFILQSNTI
jgi:hypothetical protein